MKLRAVRLLSFLLMTLTVTSFAQLELSGGYTHLTGNFGLDGFHGGLGWHFNRFVTLVGETDALFDTSRVGVFDLSATTGTVRVKSDEQNYLGGARVRIIGWKPMKVLEKRKFVPFAELLLGISRLSQTVKDNTGSVTASDSAFTWLLGGGVDYTLTGKWMARGRMDFVRTHFVESGQARLRITAGLAYTF